MDIRGALFVEVATKLGVQVYARIAAAFIATGMDLFSSPVVGEKKITPLTDDQLKLAAPEGDIHTAVKWYLKWAQVKSLPRDQEACFDIMCFWKMQCLLNRKDERPVIASDAPGWESRLCVAIAFAYQKNIVCQHGNRCVTCHIDEDARRRDVDPPLKFQNTEVTISQRSVVYYEGDSDGKSSSWLVYVRVGRFPHVAVLTVLPTNIAAWFSHFRWPQEDEFDFAVVFRSLLFDPRRIEALSEFVTLFGGGDVEDEWVMLTDEGDVAEQHRAAMTSNDEAPQLNCPHALLIRVREILNDDCDVSSSELVQILKRIARDTPSLARDAKKLVQAVIKVDAPTQHDTTRKDLVAILMMLLRNRLEVPKMRKRIKRYVYGLHVEALRNLTGPYRPIPGESRTLSLPDQEELLRQVVGGRVVEDNEVSETTSAMEGINLVSSKIANTVVRVGTSQICAKKAKKRINKGRQRIDMKTLTPKWVISDDLIAEVKAGGVTDHREAARIAQRIWKHDCFLPEIYRTAEGDEATQAEFICQWMGDGISWGDCMKYLKSLRLVKDSKRECPSTFRETSMKRLKDDIALTYRPKDASQGSLKR